MDNSLTCMAAASPCLFVCACVCTFTGRATRCKRHDKKITFPPSSLVLTRRLYCALTTPPHTPRPSIFIIFARSLRLSRSLFCCLTLTLSASLSLGVCSQLCFQAISAPPPSIHFPHHRFLQQTSPSSCPPSISLSLFLSPPPPLPFALLCPHDHWGSIVKATADNSLVFGPAFCYATAPKYQMSALILICKHPQDTYECVLVTGKTYNKRLHQQTHALFLYMHGCCNIHTPAYNNKSTQSAPSPLCKHLVVLLASCGCFPL